MKRIKAFLTALTVFAASFAVFTAHPDSVLASDEGSDVTVVTIFHTNDIHGRFVGGGNVMGMDIVAAIRADTPNSLLVDAGDTFHGLPFATLSRGLDPVLLMNVAGYDVFVPGNHDLNYGWERLLELRDEAGFAFISSNIGYGGAPLLDTYIIKEVAGVSLGFFGLTTPDTRFLTNPNNVVDIDFEDPIITAAAMVEFLQDQDVDAIIAITHLGIEEGSYYTSILVAENVEGIDLIIDGHSHSAIYGGMTVNGTMIVQAHQHLSRLGVTELTFDAGNNLTAIEADFIMADYALENIAPLPLARWIIGAIQGTQDAILSEVITEITYNIPSDREIVRTREAALGNLVADAMIFATGADIAIANGGGLRADLNAGPITVGDVVAVLPFGNFGVTKYVTPAQLREILEVGVAAFPAESGGFPQVGGFSFGFAAQAEPGSRVTFIDIRGESLELDDNETQLLLVTNDFLAAGGDGYTILRDIPTANEFGSLEEMLREYLQSELPWAYDDIGGRITLAELIPHIVAYLDSVIMRAGPHPAFEGLANIPAGAEIVIHETRHLWYLITVDDFTGWVFTGFVEYR